MCSISNTARHSSYGETSWETGDSTETSARKIQYQELIAKANSVSLKTIFKYYKIPYTLFNKKIICPFIKHKGGRESTPSFQIYNQTNTFYCHGCGVGGGPSDFVAAKDSISKKRASLKILELFGADVDEELLENFEDFSERLKIMLEFSDCVRNFRHEHFDENSHEFIENICLVYDSLYMKVTDNKMLQELVNKLKLRISCFK